MQTVKDIHNNLVFTINEAIEKAQMELYQIDQPAVNFNLNVVVEATVFAQDPASPSAITPIVSGLTLLGYRANLASVASKLVTLAASLPAPEPNPEGCFGLDEFHDTFVASEDESVQGFSLN